MLSVMLLFFIMSTGQRLCEKSIFMVAAGFHAIERSTGAFSCGLRRCATCPQSGHPSLRVTI
jgi:hypothetical protein